MNVRLVPDARMNAEEFLTWCERRPPSDDHRYELVDGEVLAVARLETIGHNRAKWAAWQTLDDVVEAAGLPCPVFIKGMGVAINDNTVRLPDVVVQSGLASDPNAVLINEPLIVVEVVSPGGSNPIADKLVDYYSVASIRHYLLSLLDKRAVIHYQRNEQGAFDIRIAKDGDIVLDPPGLAVSVAAFLGQESACPSVA
jgi:Uma2 family endonuclease